MGYRIFAHAIGLVFHNFGQALRISGVLYLMSSGVGILLASTIPADPTPLHVIVAALAVFVEITMGIWIAIAWHRYILLDETPDTVLPAFNGRRILVYFGYAALLSIIMILVVAVFVGLIQLTIAINAPILAVPLVIGVFLLIVVASYRLGIVLPATSVEKSIGLPEAWRATQGTTGALLAVALLTGLGGFLLQLPSWPLRLMHATFALEIWGAIVGWVALMVGIAILTTLYGHYVERRPIA